MPTLPPASMGKSVGRSLEWKSGFWFLRVAQRRKQLTADAWLMLRLLDKVWAVLIRSSKSEIGSRHRL